MRVAVLGDSHVAALKAAWTAMADSHAGTSLRFFASRSDGLSGLVIEGSALVAGNDTLRGHLAFTSGGLERIVPGDYDLVVIYGLRFLMSDVDEDGVYSVAVQAATRHDRLADCLALVTLRKLRAISDVACIVGPSPPPVSPHDEAQPLSADNATKAERALQSALLDGVGATLVGPPLAAMVRPFNTDRRFVDQALTLAVGDARDGGSVRAQNQRHMNADYGRLWLEALFDRLVAGPAGAV
ncbi:MAG: hypothetical protein ACRC14_13660 [Paracoccaceae bacterium]